VLAGVRDEPDEHVWGGGVGEGGAGVGDCEGGFAAAGGGGGGEEAHAFFYGGGGEGEFVEEVRVAGYCCCGV